MKKLASVSLLTCTVMIGGCKDFMKTTPDCSDPQTLKEVQAKLKEHLSDMEKTNDVELQSFVTEKNEFVPYAAFSKNLNYKFEAIRIKERNKDLDSYKCEANIIRSAMPKNIIAEDLQNYINKQDEEGLNSEKDRLDGMKSNYSMFLTKKIKQIRNESEYTKTSTQCEYDYEYGGERCYEVQENTDAITQPAQEVLTAIYEFNPDYQYDACTGTLGQCLDLAYQDKVKRLKENTQIGFKQVLEKISPILSADEKLSKKLSYTVEKAEGDKKFYVELQWKENNEE